MNECRFELKPLYCVQCGAALNEVGTCEDIAFCCRCHVDDDGKLETRDQILQPADPDSKHFLEAVRVGPERGDK